MLNDKVDRWFMLSCILFIFSIIAGIGYSEYLNYNLSVKAIEAGYQQRVEGTKVIWVKTDCEIISKRIEQ